MFGVTRRDTPKLDTSFTFKKVEWLTDWSSIRYYFRKSIIDTNWNNWQNNKWFQCSSNKFDYIKSIFTIQFISIKKSDISASRKILEWNKRSKKILLWILCLKWRKNFHLYKWSEIPYSSSKKPWFDTIWAFKKRKSMYPKTAIS